MGERDWLRVGSVPAGQVGRILMKTPHEVAVIVAHREIWYGKIIEDAHGGHLLECAKRAIFQAVKETIVEHSRATGADGE
jgi:hypothetical protein